MADPMAWRNPLNYGFASMAANQASGQPPNFSDKYNTKLAPEAEAGFQQWLASQSQATGRDVSQDLTDYDLRGWFQSNLGASLNGGHLTDQYKKPNHPTFSDQSLYSGVNGYQGGSWQGKDGAWSYASTPSNLQMYSPEQLAAYFAQVEPGATLKLPAPYAALPSPLSDPYASLLKQLMQPADSRR